MKRGNMKIVKQNNVSKRRKYIYGVSVFCVAVMIVICILLIKAYFDGKFNSVESLQAYIERFGTFGPIVLVIFQMFQVIIPVLPGILGCAAGSVLFGPAVGFWCNYIGISAGSLIAFLLARRFGKPLLDDLFPSGRYDKWSSWASKSRSYTAFLFVAMLLPLFPDDYFCYLTGITKMTVRRFTWIILLGKPWCILAYSFGFSLIK